MYYLDNTTQKCLYSTQGFMKKETMLNEFPE